MWQYLFLLLPQKVLAVNRVKSVLTVELDASSWVIHSPWGLPFAQFIALNASSFIAVRKIKDFNALSLLMWVLLLQLAWINSVSFQSMLTVLLICHIFAITFFFIEPHIGMVEFLRFPFSHWIGTLSFQSLLPLSYYACPCMVVASDSDSMCAPWMPDIKQLVWSSGWSSSGLSFMLMFCITSLIVDLSLESLQYGFEYYGHHSHSPSPFLESMRCHKDCVRFCLHSKAFRAFCFSHIIECGNHRC